jgi:xylulokinase
MNNKNKYLLGIDVGTTNVKAILFSESGMPLVMGEKEYPTYYPGPNTAEQSADDWWLATRYAIRDITSKQFTRDGKMAAICVSSQSPTLLPLDKDGNPLRRGMIWMDRRAENESKWLENEFGRERFKKIFGIKSDSFYLMPKLLWLKKHESGIYRQTKKILLTNSYINYRLTGSMAIDDQQALSVTSAYDLQKMDWSDDLEKLTGIPIHDLMPDVHSTFDVIGYVTKDAAEETGLDQGIPVVCGTSDGTANILEGGITKIGDAAESTGTSTLFFVAHDKPLNEQGKILAIPQYFPVPDVPYTLGGPINSTGASLKWYLNTYKDYIKSLASEVKKNNLYNVLNHLAEKAPAGSGGLLYFPYLSGERAPFWNSYLKGMFIGLTAASTHESIVRSLYEGTSFALKSVVDEAYKEGVVINKFRSSGGGANSDIWLKIKASMLNMPLEVSTGMGGAPLGDAIIAGYGVGLYKDFLKAINAFQRVDKVIDPVDEWVTIYNDMYPLYLDMVKRLNSDLITLEELVDKHSL